VPKGGEIGSRKPKYATRAQELPRGAERSHWVVQMLQNMVEHYHVEPTQRAFRPEV